jgi:hypothetical protein
MLTDDFVRNRAARERHRHHAATRCFNGLAHRFRYFVRLAGREPELALAVTDGHERVERESATALHDFRDAIDGDHVLDEIGSALATLIVAAAAAAVTTATITAAALTTATSAAAALTAASAATLTATATAAATRTTASTARAAASAASAAAARAAATPATTARAATTAAATSAATSAAFGSACLLLVSH